MVIGDVEFFKLGIMAIHEAKYAFSRMNLSFICRRMTNCDNINSLIGYLVNNDVIGGDNQLPCSFHFTCSFLTMGNHANALQPLQKMYPDQSLLRDYLSAI